MIDVNLYKGRGVPATVQKPPAPPLPSDAAAGASQAVNRVRAGRGYQSTILTSGMGASGGGGILKQLLGQ